MLQSNEWDAQQSHAVTRLIMLFTFLPCAIYSLSLSRLTFVAARLYVCDCGHHIVIIYLPSSTSSATFIVQKQSS